MEPINKATALQQLLRYAQNQRTSAQSKGSAASDGQPLSLQQQIKQRLAHISPQAPDRITQALRVHVSAMLTQELGEQLASEPAFAHLVADVSEAIQLAPQYPVLAQFLQQQLTLSHTKTSP
ncbi:hypothetical protein HZU77_014980 [Neisseriaceae bacterium TC5R-5]|nr:hypothetical protein [Neisseriaceae bacterium TC5R-5]